MASKWSVSTKRNKPAVKNKSRPPARINGARGRLRAFSCLFLNAWGFESPYGVKWAMRISQTAVFGASDPYFRKSNFSVPNPPVFSSECKNTALSCGVFAVHLFYQHNLATPTGLEPVTSGVTGRRSTLLNYGAILVPSMGLEPIRDCSHQPLKLACLPFHHNGIHYLSHGILSYRSYGESPVAIFSNPPGTIFHSVCFFFSLFWLI